ncbi:MAG: hypothetical protein ACJAX7_002374 [Saprospiraceae bacterium]|jgi:hypothetical protein
MVEGAIIDPLIILSIPTPPVNITEYNILR